MPAGLPLPDPLLRLVGREDDGEDPRVPDPPRDQLRVLPAEVEDDDRALVRGQDFSARATAEAGTANRTDGRRAMPAPRNGATATRTGVTRAPGA